MPGCNGDCNVSSLLCDFCLGEEAVSIGLNKITVAIGRLCTYAKEAGKLLCEIRMKEMEGFVQHLYGLENAGYTAEDSKQEIWIVTLFYDYLVGRGCMVRNPAIELKDAAIRQLLEKLMEKEGGKDE
jgi:site-specific recombinase XerD